MDFHVLRNCYWAGQPVERLYIPAGLQDVEENDLDTLGLPFCLQTAAMMTLVDGVKQWDSPPKSPSGGLLIGYKDEFKATVEMETVGGEPADGQKIVFYMYHSDFPFFRNGDVTFAVNNFVFLAREGFYDGLTFHRVLPGELVQTGDPPGPLDGAGYTFGNERTVKIEHDFGRASSRSPTMGSSTARAPTAASGSSL